MAVERTNEHDLAFLDHRLAHLIGVATGGQRRLVDVGGRVRARDEAITADRRDGVVNTIWPEIRQEVAAAAARLDLVQPFRFVLDADDPVDDVMPDPDVLEAEL